MEFLKDILKEVSTLNIQWGPISGIGSAIAAVCSLIITILQFRYTRFSNKVKMIVRIESIKQTIVSIFDEWKLENQIEWKEEFSSSYINIQNLGTEAAHDIRYQFDLINKKVLSQYIEKNKAITEQEKGLEIEFNKEDFLIVERSSSKTIGQIFNYKTRWQAHDYLAGKGKFNVALPNNLIVLLNFIFLSKMCKYENEFFVPVMQLNVRYKNNRNKECRVSFYISPRTFVSSYPAESSEVKLEFLLAPFIPIKWDKLLRKRFKELIARFKN
ncbi:hypothetical protein [Listeria sp. PSOL-1]|uniref:hypothetical protein n=1 Tax=Listeria sp. PSOL-1 TaxID=1844999 RepID=UPI0013D1DB77|nr:hypothetical protein [Listeria sp. PSOL-1]